MSWRQMYWYIRRLLANFRRDRRQGIIFLVSFLFSTILWGLVTLTQEYESELPVQVLIEKDESVLSSIDVNHTVVIRISGSGLDLLFEHWRLSKDTVRIGFDSSMFTLNRIRVADFQEEMSQSFSSQISIQRYSPANLPVAFKPKEEKSVPIRLATHILLEESYQHRSEPRLMENRITLYGPREALDTISEWRTRPGTTARIRDRRQILIPVDTSGGFLANPSMVAVAVDPEPYTEWHFDRKIIATGLPANTEVRFSHPAIRYWCALPIRVADSLENLGKVEIQPLEISFTELVEDADGEFRPPVHFLETIGHPILTEPSSIRFSIIRNRTSLR